MQDAVQLLKFNAKMLLAEDFSVWWIIAKVELYQVASAYDSAFMITNK